MATYATDLQTVNLCDNDTDWSELSGHTSGSSPADDTENFIHNSASVSQATGQATGTNAGMEYDYGSAITWTSGDVFMAWQYYAAPTNLQSWSTGGMRIGIGSSSGNMRFWNALGDNFGDYPYGGWQNTAIDPEITGDGTDDGTPVAGTYQIFGSLPNVRAKITKGTPHAVDVIRYGRGEIRVTGTSATFSGMATANDATTARWGLFQLKSGSYLWKGLMSLGLAGTSVTFSDSNKTIRVEDTPRVAAGFNKIEINNTGSSVTLSGITFQGMQISITGSAPVSAGNLEVVDNASIDIDSCSFIDLGTLIFNDGTNSNNIDDSIFRRCGQITQGGATFNNCIFDKAEGTVGLLVDDLDTIDNCTFNSDGTGHGINLGTITTTQSIAWDNNDSGYTASSSGNETILVSVNSGQTLTINVGSGYTTPSVYNTGSGTVDVVSGQVTTKITVIDLDTSSTISGAKVLVWVSDATNFPYNASVTITGTGTTATVAHTAHGLASNDNIIIEGVVEDVYNGAYPITVTGVDSYTYTTNETITTSPATGTITATFAFINDATDALGVISDSRTVSSDQPILGRIRKASASPFYKQGSISGIIDNATGFSTTVQLVSDE